MMDDKYFINILKKSFRKCDNNIENLNSFILNIETLLKKDNIQDSIFEYKFPSKNYSMKFYYQDKYLDFDFLKDNCIICSYNEQTLRREKKQIQQVLMQSFKNNKLSFYDNCSKEFADYILNIKENDVLNLNNKLTVVCIKKINDDFILKELYQGSINELNLKDMNDLNTYTKEDINYLYSLAENSISQISKQNKINKNNINNIYKQWENIIKEQGSSDFYMGKIKLLGQKTENNIEWYDTNGNHLSKDNIINLISIFKTYIPEIKITYWNDDLTYEPVNKYIDIHYQKYNIEENMKKIDNFILKNDYNKIIHEASLISKKTNKYYSLSINIFDEKENGFIPKVITFSINEKTQEPNIYLINFENNNILNPPANIEQITENDFILICEEQFNNQVSLLKEAYKQEISNRNISKENQEKALEILINNTKKPIINIQQNMEISEDFDQLIERYYKKAEDYNDSLDLKNIINKYFDASLEKED